MSQAGGITDILGMDYPFLQPRYLEKEFMGGQLHLYTSVFGGGLILRGVELPEVRGPMHVPSPAVETLEELPEAVETLEELPEEVETLEELPKDEEVLGELPEEVETLEDEEVLGELPEEVETVEELPEDEEVLGELAADKESLEEPKVDEKTEKVISPAKLRRSGGGCRQGWPWRPGRSGWLWALLPMTVLTAPTGWMHIPCWSRPPDPPMRTTTRWSGPSSGRSCR